MGGAFFPLHFSLTLLTPYSLNPIFVTIIKAAEA